MTKPIQIKNLTLGSGIPKICVPLTGKTREAILDEAKNAVLAGAQMLEWRADFFEGLKEKEKLEEMLSLLSQEAGEVPLLFTIRTDEEGGNCSISAEDYAFCSLTAAKSGKADLVDVEVFGHGGENKKLIPGLQSEGALVIASSHDFSKTDSEEVLLKRFQDMDATGADILKMAVMPEGFGDVAAIMQATSRMAAEFTNKPLISMAMGSIGSISRISGENFHSCVTFGTVGAASAPGQISIVELRTMMEALHRKNMSCIENK
ncbi:MAG: type I 3-dehydroquinate dehydratase [Blautia sp.]|nr:type I 3-dehydroquinate dehydratase [Blautia sp.]